MLEAFQASSHESPTESGGASQETSSASTVSRRAKPGLPDVAPELFAVIFSVLIIGSFFLGRWYGASSVQAADETMPAPAEVSMIATAMDFTEAAPALMDDLAVEETVAAAQPLETLSEPDSLSPMEQHTSDFMDKENKVTLRVIYYGDDEQGQRRAYQTALHLEEMGFPVVNPIVKGDYVYVCVGAAPSKNDQELMRYQRELQLVPGPKPYGKPGDYASAFPYNIEKLITR